MPGQQQQGATRRSHASASSGPSNRSSMHREELKQIGHWKIGKTIGKGSSGRVKYARHQVTGREAAVKIITKAVTDQRIQLGIEREITIMKLIEHPNVLSLFDVWETDHELYLVMEYVSGGELFEYLVNTKGRLPPHEALHYFQQIIFAVDYCHRFNIRHRDLKPENLLMDKYKNIKVADFGMAAWQADNKLLETSCGSPHYASPEIVAGKEYDGTASDIWSCGIILFALLTGRLPFDDDNIRNLLQKVKLGEFEMPEDIDMRARNLLRRMLDKNPESRITMADIMKHPYFTSQPPRQGSRPLPVPFSRELMEQPVTAADIDAEILSHVRTLWHGTDDADIYRALMRPGEAWEKAVYHLLVRYRDRDLENYNMDNESESDSETSGVYTGIRGRRAPPVPVVTARSPTKHRRAERRVVEQPSIQNIRRKPAPLQETDSVQSTPTHARPNGPTPKKATTTHGNPHHNPHVNPAPQPPAGTASRAGSRLARRVSAERTERAERATRSPTPGAIGHMEVPPSITVQQATPVKEYAQMAPMRVDVPRSSLGPTAPPPMSPRSFAQVTPPHQPPPLSPPQLDNPQLQTFLDDLANQVNSMTMRSSTASSNSATSTIQTPEFLAYLSYMSQQSATPVASPRPDTRQQIHSSMEERTKMVVEEEEEDTDQFGDAPDDDTEGISLHSISRFGTSPVPQSPMSPMVGLGFGPAPRAPSRSGPPPVSGRWSSASGSYRARSVSSRCESPIFTPGVSAGFHSPTPVPESARNSSGSSYGGHHSSPSGQAGPSYLDRPPALTVNLQAHRSAPPIPTRQSSSGRVPSGAPRPSELTLEPKGLESMLGRENSYVLISKLDDMPDDTSTMSWSQKRGSAFPTHRGTAMLKKRKKISIDASVTPITPQQGTTKRSWFGNLFSFKPASYDIVLTHCAVINDGREIVRRCLQEQGVAVKSIDHDGMLALKCKVTDTRDISGSHIKGVRFRIEFTRTLCIAGGHERFAMNACLTLEKGAQSLFTATYNSLKKAVESDDRPLPSPVPTTISEPITMPRPRVQNQRPSIFAALNVGPLNVGASPRIGNISAPTSPQFGPQFGTFQFTGVQRPNTIRF